MTRSTSLLLAGAALGALGVGLLLSRRPHAATPVARLAPPQPVPAVRDAPALRTYVAAHAAESAPEARDRVGQAELRLGYAVARKEGYAKARVAFLATAKAHEGVGAQSAAFGGVADQAAYQAVCCLAGEGKADEARKGFEAYLRERPLSPLVHAAYRRLQRLNGGESTPAWDRLLQADVATQERRIRFETSVCGPKCLEHILEAPSPSGSSWRGGGGRGPDYKTLAKLCGTTDDGTTLAGMRKGLKSLGRESWAARLNRGDLARATLPLILLQGDHYVVLERVEGDVATVWDPRLGASTPWKLPPEGDPDFSATALLLQKPEGL